MPINNPINNKVGGNNPGNIVTFSIINSSNVANSAARKVISVAGTSAADPFMNITVNGATTWTKGIDQNNANLCISQSNFPGTNDAWRISSLNTRLMPLQPLFFSYVNSAQTNQTGDGTLYTLICDTKLIDVNNNYNNSTGTFTAPVSGIYKIESNINLSNISSSETRLQLFFVSSSLTYAVVTEDCGQVRDIPLGNMSVNGGGLFKLNAGDTVVTQLRISFGSKTVQINGFGFGAIRSWTTGFLLY